MRTLQVTLLSLVVLGLNAGCSRPAMPSMVGQNMFHDISQVRRGMSANEVERIMGSHFKTLYEEGIMGVDSGNYIWEYPEGRIYFSLNGVTRVAPN